MIKYYIWYESPEDSFFPFAINIKRTAFPSVLLIPLPRRIDEWDAEDYIEMVDEFENHVHNKLWLPITRKKLIKEIERVFNA